MTSLNQGGRRSYPDSPPLAPSRDNLPRLPSSPVRLDESGQVCVRAVVDYIASTVLSRAGDMLRESSDGSAPKIKMRHIMRAMQSDDNLFAMVTGMMRDKHSAAETTQSVGGARAARGTTDGLGAQTETKHAGDQDSGLGDHLGSSAATASVTSPTRRDSKRGRTTSSADAKPPRRIKRRRTSAKQPPAPPPAHWEKVVMPAVVWKSAKRGSAAGSCLLCRGPSCASGGTHTPCDSPPHHPLTTHQNTNERMLTTHQSTNERDSDNLTPRPTALLPSLSGNVVQRRLGVPTQRTTRRHDAGAWRIGVQVQVVRATTVAQPASHASAVVSESGLDLASLGW